MLRFEEGDRVEILPDPEKGRGQEFGVIAYREGGQEHLTPIQRMYEVNLDRRFWGESGGWRALNETELREIEDEEDDDDERF